MTARARLAVIGTGRLLLILATILFILAALTVEGYLKFMPAEALALYGFAAWVGSGAVA